MTGSAGPSPVIDTVRSAAIRDEGFIADSSRAGPGDQPDAGFADDTLITPRGDVWARQALRRMNCCLEPAPDVLKWEQGAGVAALALRNFRVDRVFGILTGRHANILRSSHDDVPVQKAGAARRAPAHVQAAGQL